MPKLLTLNPFDLRCAICRRPILNIEIVAVVDLPDGKPGVVHGEHHGVASLLSDYKMQLVTGAQLRSVAQAFREEISPEEALKVLYEQNPELAEKANG